MTYPLYEELLALATEWQKTREGFPKPTARSAHQEMAYKAALKSMTDRVDFDKALTALMPKVWKQKGWQIRLMRGTSLVIKQKGDAPKGREPITLKAPFTAHGVALMMGALLGRAKDLHEAPATFKTFLCYGSYGLCTLRKGFTPAEAIAYDTLMKLDIATQLKQTSLNPQALFERHHSTSFSTGKDFVTDLPWLWTQVFTHPFVKASPIADKAADAVVAFSNMALAEKLAVLTPVVKKKQHFGSTNPAEKHLQRLTETMATTLEVLNRSTPRTGQVSSWVIIGDTHRVLEARDGREALITAHLLDMIDGTQSSLFDSQAIPKTNAYTGNFLDMAD